MVYRKGTEAQIKFYVRTHTGKSMDVNQEQEFKPGLLSLYTLPERQTTLPLPP